MSCIITPISAFQSTNLNSKIDCYGRLGDRIVRALGAPLVSVEIHQDQLFENISIACEMFSKYAGYTKEYLVFDSRLYERGAGIRLDHLYTLANSNLTDQQKVNHITNTPETSPYITTPDSVYVVNYPVSGNVFLNSTELSAILSSGLVKNQIFDLNLYSKAITATNISNFFTESSGSFICTNSIPFLFLSAGATLLSAQYATLSTNNYNVLTGFFNESYNSNAYSCGVKLTTPNNIRNNMFDYDLMTYRKVIEVVDFEEGSTTGINTLFTIEQTLAQQTYFSYAMGNYGFDLISWYCVKNWLDTREKVLATRRSFEFNSRTQYLRMYPEPSNNVATFYGILQSWVERPLVDLIKEQWVYMYALALCKISVGRVRGKYSNVQMFGNTLFGQDILNEGLQEKEKLEEKLFTGHNAGYDSDSYWSGFFIG